MSPLPLPSGGDQDRGGSLLAITWAETFICIVVLGLRFYSRMKLKNIGIDDWMMLITLVSAALKNDQESPWLLMTL